MFSLDKLLLEFVGANWMSMYVLITLLKGIALLTKSTTDDKIATLLGNMFSTLRKGKVPDNLPSLDAVQEAAPKIKEVKKNAVEESPRLGGGDH